jgi:hypothetical protein
MKKQMYQNVIIVLSDDSIHTFTGKAFMSNNETRRIKDIKFTRPKELPFGFTFEETDSNKSDKSEKKPK